MGLGEAADERTLPYDHYLTERCSGHTPLTFERPEELLEGKLLVSISPQDRRAYAPQDFTGFRVAAEVGAQDHHVGKKPNYSFGFPSLAIRQKSGHAYILLAGVS